MVELELRLDQRVNLAEHVVKGVCGASDTTAVDVQLVLQVRVPVDVCQTARLLGQGVDPAHRQTLTDR